MILKKIFYCEYCFDDSFKSKADMVEDENGGLFCCEEHKQKFRVNEKFLNKKVI